MQCLDRSSNPPKWSACDGLLDQATQQAVARGADRSNSQPLPISIAMLITGGAWRVEDGRLFGRSLGPDVATRATGQIRVAAHRLRHVPRRHPVRATVSTCASPSGT
jgi:hypothetical protein